jgi:phage terminase large subunit-like protein
MGLRGPGARPKGVRREPAIASSGSPAWLNPKLSRANRVIAFIETLTLRAGKGAGKPFKLRPWQKRIIRDIYRTERGERVVREALLTLARKNGKTQLAAALCACHLYGSEALQGGECYSAAADRDQAGRIFRELEAFIIGDPDADSRCNIQRFLKRIEVMEGPGKGSIYQALSSDATKAHSLAPSFVIADELAQWRGRELFQNLRTGFGAHPEPLFVIISTMSPDPHSVMSEVVDRGRKVLEGTIIDPSFYVAIHEVPPGKTPEEIAAQMTDERIWRLANPALGDFLSLEAVRKDAREAIEMPSREGAFRNLRLNQPVEADERFIEGADWLACTGRVDQEALRGRPCWGGLDLSSVGDLTALTLFFPADGGQVLCWFWLPAERVAERVERDRVPYDVWTRQGLIEPNRGKAIDMHAIALRLAEIAGQYDLRGLAYDRFRIEDLLRILGDEGISLPLEPWGQGYKDMAPAVSALEMHVLNRTLQHGGHQVLAWNISNCVVTSDAASNRKLDKEKAREKIDGAVALVMAVGLHARTLPEENRRAFDPASLARMFGLMERAKLQTLGLEL